MLGKVDSNICQRGLLLLGQKVLVLPHTIVQCMCSFGIDYCMLVNVSKNC